MRMLLRIIVLLVAATGLAFAASDNNSCDISFTVIRDFNGKPVRNAEIVLHPVGKNGKQKANGVELKADNEGKASYPGLPYGKIRVQVIAPGLQTFGEDFDIREKTKEIEIKMKKPQGQYSIYEDKKTDKDKEKDKPKDPPK